MNRSLGVERVYHLGDYRSLRITDYINEIPIEKLDLNPEAIKLIRGLQLLGIEKAYYSYSYNSEILNTDYDTDEKKIQAITELETDTIEKLKEILKDLLKTEDK